jgi:hypothetical protein
MFRRLPAGSVRNDSSAGGIRAPLLHYANQAHDRFSNSNLCAWMRRRPRRRQYRHGETETSLRSSRNKSYLVQAGAGENATTVGASPNTNLLRNNDDEHGRTGLGRTPTSGWQLDERDNNECRFTDGREAGTTRNCRHGQRVTYMNKLRWANSFVVAPTLSINRNHGFVRPEHETLAMLAKAKRLTSDAIAKMNTDLWKNWCKRGNLLKVCFDELLSVDKAPSLRQRG